MAQVIKTQPVKKINGLVVGLLVLQVITAFIAGANSCEGGLKAYLITGIAALTTAVIYILWFDGLSANKKLTLSLLTVLIFVAVWIAGIFFGGFQLMCRLF